MNELRLKARQFLEELCEATGVPPPDPNFDPLAQRDFVTKRASEAHGRAVSARDAYEKFIDSGVRSPSERRVISLERTDAIQEFAEALRLENIVTSGDAIDVDPLLDGAL